MLMEVKNQIKVSFLSVKYALMREMLNKTTFITNIVFMLLNNSAFIVQWIVLFALKDNVGGYTFKQVLLLWGIAAGTYGVSRFFFTKAFSLSDVINNGKLDSFLVQPKNVLLSTITTDVTSSALGDLIYAYIMLCLYGVNIFNLLLFTLFIICGGFIVTSIAIIFGSLSFWFSKSDVVTDTANSMMINFATYPDGIFKGVVRIMFFTFLPVGIVNYLPVWIISEFNIWFTLLIILVTIVFISLAFIMFYKGLKKYSSSNLMMAKI